MTPYDSLLNATRDERSRLLATPILTQVATGCFDLQTYHQFLANAYHHVRHTVPLMMLCGSRLSRDQHWLQPLLREYIDEEIGHEQWILDDLRAAGADAAQIAAGSPNFETELLVRYVRDYIVQENAAGFFGMVLVLEGTSTALASATADIVQQTLSLPDAAFTYLRSHGELDHSHVAFFAGLINRMSEADLIHVTHVARRAYRLYGEVLQSAGVREACAHAA